MNYFSLSLTHLKNKQTFRVKMNLKIKIHYDPPVYKHILVDQTKYLYVCGCLSYVDKHCMLIDKRDYCQIHLQVGKSRKENQDFHLSSMILLFYHDLFHNYCFVL